MQKRPRQVRIDPDVLEDAKKIADATGLSQVEVIRQMVRAGVRAIKENGYKLPLPLRLRVVGEKADKPSGDPVVLPLRHTRPSELNEPKPTLPGATE